jgi:hypothetical protein
MPDRRSRRLLVVSLVACLHRPQHLAHVHGRDGSDDGGRQHIEIGYLDGALAAANRCPNPTL